MNSIIKTWCGIFSVSPKVAFWNAMTSFHLNSKLRSNLTLSFVDKHHKTVIAYLEKNYEGIINKYKSTAKVHNKALNNIWMLWWQGYDKAPELVKRCIYSVHSSFKNYNIVVLTESNYKNYIHLPDYIITKFKEGKISFAQLSDIIRLTALAEYGGIWMDATILCGTNVPDISNFDFFSLNTGYDKNSFYVTKGRWTGFFMGSRIKGYPFFCFARDLIYAYWKKEKALIDYFLIDYIIQLGYIELEDFHNDVDSLNVTCPNVLKILDCFKENRARELKECFSNSNWCFKLDYRKYTPYNPDTKAIYDMIIDDYQFLL